jgi:hypothetical protein
MKAHHKSGIGYAETLEDGDVIQRPGINQPIRVHNPQQVGNGIKFVAEIIKQSTPGHAYVEAYWHRHELVMPA